MKNYLKEMVRGRRLKGEEQTKKRNRRRVTQLGHVGERHFYKRICNFFIYNIFQRTRGLKNSMSRKILLKNTHMMTSYS